jgi:diguanylate cyclase
MVINEQTKPATIIRTSFRLFIIIFIVTGTVISGVMLAFYRWMADTDLSNIKEKERFAIDLQHQVVSDIFFGIAGDLLFLSQQNELTEYLSTEDELLLDKMGAEYLSAIKQKRIYDQIRFLDSTGMEIVRVNENHGTPVRVAAGELQSKQKRYYFQDCFKLDKGEIYISPFDLNIEQGKIETPLKPMIRLGTPVFTQTGEKRGIVLVNYYGQKLLDKIIESEAVSEGYTMLLNADGYWLLSPQDEQEWGFMFDDDQRTLAVTDPAAWQKINGLDEGQFETDQGIYTFKTVYPVKNEEYRASKGSVVALGQSTAAAVDHKAYRWILVSFFSTERISATIKSILMKFFFIGGGLFLLIAIGALIISFAVTKQKIYQSQLQVMALFDPLTKLPNRTLFFDRLNMTAEHSCRYASSFGLLYIDLDGFKQVNDRLGHEAGDELLKIVGSLLLKSIRKSDTAARLGGDEFAVIYAESESLATLEAFASRIIAELSSPVELATGRVTIGASIGIASFPADSDNVEELINLADRAMYTSKRQGKNRYTLPEQNSG